MELSLKIGDYRKNYQQKSWDIPETRKAFVYFHTFLCHLVFYYSRNKINMKKIDLIPALFLSLDLLLVHQIKHLILNIQYVLTGCQFFNRGVENWKEF